MHIIERVLCKDDECVDHIDENKINNNKLENLQLLLMSDKSTRSTALMVIIELIHMVMQLFLAV